MILSFSICLIFAMAATGCRDDGTGTAEASLPPTATAGKSVVLIVVDTLRADHLGVYGYARDTSPGIDRWAERARVYERAYSTSPWTLPAMASALSGEVPSRHAVGSRVEVRDDRVWLTLNPSMRWLPELLRRAGYETAAIVNNFFLAPDLGFDRGFDLYDYRQPTGPERRDAAATVDRALAWLDERASSGPSSPGGERRKPFFLLLHIFDPHFDYAAPEPFRGRWSDPRGMTLELPLVDVKQVRQRVGELTTADRRYLVDAYDEEVAYTDAQVARFLTGLGERDLGRSTLVALTSDHGEELFEHDGFEHGHALWDEVVRIPLILRGPGIRPGRVRAPVTIADLAPTILDAAGLRIPAGTDGVSLLSPQGLPAAGRALIIENTLYGSERKALVRWPYKGVFDTERGRGRLYDLEADPEESRNLSATHARAMARLERAVRELVADASEAREEGFETMLDEETLDRLRALGYIE